MEGLTQRHFKKSDGYYMKCSGNCYKEDFSCEDCVHLEILVNRLGEIEDILGDNYDLARLREIVEADRDGRCVVLPVPLHSVLLDMSDTCRPDVLKDFRISATWTHNGIVFYCPWNIFNQNIEKGYIRLMSESAEAALKGRYQNEDC